MRRAFWRQATAVGLGLLLLFTLARTAWTAVGTARTNVVFSEAGKWLQGKVVVVDPGHGGDDPGAVVGRTREKDLVLQIGLQVKSLLEQHGAKVVMTRETDMDLGGKIREELGKRVALIDEHKADLFISVHANKDRCNCWGAQTFYQRNGMPAGKELAVAIQNQLRQLTPTTRSALKADYFVLRSSRVPAAMVEVGFLSHAEEHKRLQEPAYQQTVAQAVVLGLVDFLRKQETKPPEAGSPH